MSFVVCLVLLRKLRVLSLPVTETCRWWWGCLTCSVGAASSSPITLDVRTR